MADAAVADPNNPAGEAPGDLSDEIMSTLGLSDTSSAAEKIAGKAAGNEPNAPSQPSPSADGDAGEPGAGGGTAHTPAPEPSPSAPPEPAPQPAAPEPAPAAPSAAPAAPSAAPATPPAAPQPQQPVPDEAALREASLKAQVDALQRTVAELRANPQPASGQPGAESAQPGTPPAVPQRYGLTLPEQLTSKLLSDNPQDNVAAITQLMNDLGTIVHHQIVTQLRAEMDSKLQSIPRGPDPAEAAQEAARNLYYEAFPAHNNALVLPIINAEAQKMAAEFPGLPWDANYVNALGSRVNKVIEEISGGKAQPSGAEPTPPAAPAPPAAPNRPPAFMPSGNRGAGAVTPAGNISDEIVDVLDPFAASRSG